MKILKIIVEIPINSNIKYEYNRDRNIIEVDRILRNGFKYPTNYGFIPKTLDWDGDELDVLIYSEETFFPGSILNVRIVGAMKMIDSGEIDTKLIAVHHDDYRLDNINDINDISQKWLDNVKNFFTNYKNWKGKNMTLISGFENKEWANNELKECYKLFKEYGKMKKGDFILKMKAKYPKKYLV